jgi:hypothetical protein
VYPSTSRPRAPFRIAIAIPARDEAARLPNCLAALADQRDADNRPLNPSETAVVVLANNCGDDTADVARSLAPALPFRLAVQEMVLPPSRAHAGGARRAAMDAAAALLGDDAPHNAAILSTDADGRAAPNWLAANLVALEAGADAVAGAIEPDPEEIARLPPALRRREARETRYAALLDEMAAVVDPDLHDPWPRHSAHSGASIALTLVAYRRVGGLPEVPVGEDRALFEALARVGMRVRHCPAARVTVSCRLDGRAAGGMADTMRRRLAETDSAPVDPLLEPALDALWRLRCRRALRLLRTGSPSPGDPRRLAFTLGLSPIRLLAIARIPGFSEAWDLLQAESRSLRRRTLTARQVETETARAVSLLNTLRRSKATFSTSRLEPPMPACAADPGGIAPFAPVA